MPERNDITLVYDRECPVCDYYSKRIDVSEANLVLVNARESSKHMDEITSAGLDIDKGMALKVGDTIYIGCDAVHELALLSSGKGLFNKATASVFRWSRVAKAIYPVLVACRNLLLKVLRRSPINNLGNNRKQRF
ncbi:MAG: DUF393 domain-containing protein [Gammaproteobacteria bacterium]|nr:DUF393 domain-containing protein [Gammaproteobacteria bacterium]